MQVCQPFSVLQLIDVLELFHCFQLFINILCDVYCKIDKDYNNTDFWRSAKLTTIYYSRVTSDWLGRSQNIFTVMRLHLLSTIYWKEIDQHLL